jgi:ankyrin repeat protein
VQLGESALHYAVRLGRKDVVSRLLCAGADTELKVRGLHLLAYETTRTRERYKHTQYRVVQANVDGKTPTEAAAASSHAVIANLLQRFDGTLALISL